MELINEKKQFRLLFTKQEINSGCFDRARISLWAHCKVNPKIFKYEICYTAYQISWNRLKNWFDLFQRICEKEKPSRAATQGRQKNKKHTFSLYEITED